MSGAVKGRGEGVCEGGEVGAEWGVAFFAVGWLVSGLGYEKCFLCGERASIIP